MEKSGDEMEVKIVEEKIQMEEWNREERGIKLWEDGMKRRTRNETVGRWNEKSGE